MDMFYYDCTVTLIDATKCPTTLVGFSDEEANKDGSKLNFNANGCIGLKSISLDVPINSINLSRGLCSFLNQPLYFAYHVLKRHLSVLYLPYSSYKINYSLHLLMCAIFPKILIFFIDDSKLVYYFVKGIYNWNYSIFSPP